MQQFTHLHVHSEYSVLDGLAKTQELVNMAKKDGMTALALTDHGTMFGIKEFYDNCRNAGIKPILGCEVYVAPRGRLRKESKEDRAGYHLILLAKNLTGYRNLLKLATLSSKEGFFYKPRIDNELLEKYHDGLIASSACLGGEIPKHILHNRMDEASQRIEWFKNLFGDDFYLELMRHKTDDPKMKAETYDRQVEVNARLVELAARHDVKLIATNDVHFAKEKDAETHDILICLVTNSERDNPNRLRYTKQEWLKTREEMQELFSDIPEALDNTMEIADKVETYELNSPPIMPVFEIPKSFGTEESYRQKFDEDTLRKEFSNDAFERLGGYEKVLRIKFESDYLEKLVYEGAKSRYGDKLDSDTSLKERIDFELNTIKTMGFPGYFLIVQDFINEAKNMGVIVGPGRGSAAGSVVAYATGITNVDPIKYELLFERFLNPDRISMPDIDIDFDDDGRDKVLDYVRDKYGDDNVAQICTFGTMATKSSIRDVARVLNLPLSEADRLAKMVPEKPKITFKEAFEENRDLKKEAEEGTPLIKEVLYFAQQIEGTVRQIGTHACGVLIGKGGLENHLPLMKMPDAKMMVTQYHGDLVEPIGMLKMDFLGLKTLSIIRTTINNIKDAKGVEVDMNNIPREDKKTYELFSKGQTTGIFQFESDNMKKYLKQLKPSRFMDLVAMNALHRPGPMQYIPSYIHRKYGKEKIEYDHPIMEEYLKETFGITVFQEQVMLLSRRLAGFTRGESDTLRKAMGKKKFDLMDKLKVKFKEGCLKNQDFLDGCKQTKKKPEKLIDKIWKDWENFASYAFNKSHAVCYAELAYTTTYLKANYPAEFMAAVMSRNQDEISKISLQMEECRRMGIKVLGPSVNDSYSTFHVDENNNIRFGLNAIKGVGSNAVKQIIKQRKKDGKYKDIFDFISRVDLHQVNKKSLESLVYGGGFDCFDGIERYQFMCKDKQEIPFLETLIKYGNQKQADKSNGISIWGDMLEDTIQTPGIPTCEKWSVTEMLKKEKEYIGMYMSAHPLDEYKLEMSQLNLVPVSDLKTKPEDYTKKDFMIAGYITDAFEKRTKNNKLYGSITLEDYSDSYKITLFGKDYINHKSLFCKGYGVLIRGRMEPGWKNKDELQFKIRKMEELSTLKDGFFKEITLQMFADKVDEQFIEDLKKVIKNQKGKMILNISLYDDVIKQRIDFSSGRYKVDLNEKLIDFLENNSAIYNFKMT
ncbi:MAG: DNA polymerase III subunit alpha [Bacteroidales bacterium]